MPRNQNPPKKKKAQNSHDRGKESTMSLSQKILPVSCSIQRLHHAKVPKNEIDQMRRLALIVALLLDQSARYTRVISTSSIFSVGRRWCCVGGGGAARTWNSQKMPVNIPKLNVSQPAESTAAILGSWLDVMPRHRHWDQDTEISNSCPWPRVRNAPEPSMLFVILSRHQSQVAFLQHDWQSWWCKHLLILPAHQWSYFCSWQSISLGFNGV